MCGRGGAKKTFFIRLYINSKNVWSFQDGSKEVVVVPRLGLDRPRHLLLHPDQPDDASVLKVRTRFLWLGWRPCDKKTF